MSTDIIKLNGRSYDATSGKPISEKPLQHKVAAFKKQVISDMVGAAHAMTKPASAHSLKPSVIPKKAVRTPRPLNAHQGQRAKTLARFAVKKPAPSTKAQLRAHPAVDSNVVLHKPHHPVRPSQFINAERLKRAAHTQHSQLVQHFTKSQQQVRPKLQPLKVQPAQTATQVIPASPAHPATKPHERHFDAVLRQATSHKQPFVRSAKKGRLHFSNHVIAIMVAVIAIIIIGGFIFTQNLPQIDVRLASIHTGFQVTLPAYQPAGFAFMDHVQADSGKAILSYHSTTDSRQFSIAQQTTNWTEPTLHAFVASTTLPLQSWQDKGHTVYLYGNHLTWVSNGIWYQITNHADLSSTQLLNIATSM